MVVLFRWFPRCLDRAFAITAGFASLLAWRGNWQLSTERRSCPGPGARLSAGDPRFDGFGAALPVGPQPPGGTVVGFGVGATEYMSDEHAAMPRSW